MLGPHLGLHFCLLSHITYVEDRSEWGTNYTTTFPFLLVGGSISQVLFWGLDIPFRLEDLKQLVETFL